MSSQSIRASVGSTENTASSIFGVLDRVYRAVAWQRIDQFRYNTVLRNLSLVA
jgi:hypothetical protein